MFFRKKIKRVLDVEALEKKHKDNGPLDLEKGDLPAIIISAILVFLPVLLVMIILFLLVSWFFSRV